MTASAQQEYIPRSVQRRNLRFVVLDGVAIGLMSAAASFVSVFVIRLEASPLWVSLISSAPAAIALIMVLPWSRFAERQTRPQQVLAVARAAVHVVYPLIAIVPFFLQGEAAAKAIVIIWSLSAFPSSLSNMMFTMVMGHAVPPARRSFLMSRRWAFLGLAKLIALPLASQLIDRLGLPKGYQIMYAVNAAIAVLAFYCASQLRVPKRDLARPRTTDPLFDRIRDGVRTFTRARSFLIFVSGRAALNLGLALVSAIIPIYWIKHLGASDAWVGYFNAALSGATLVSYFVWVRWKRTHGTRWTLIPSVIGVAIYPALLILARTPAAVLPIIAFNGLVGSGLNLAFFDALLDNCPPDKEARFIAINITAINLMGVIGPPLGAALLALIDIRWVLVIGTCISLVGVSIFSFAKTGSRERAKAEQE